MQASDRRLYVHNERFVCNLRELVREKCRASRLKTKVPLAPVQRIQGGRIPNVWPQLCGPARPFFGDSYCSNAITMQQLSAFHVHWVSATLWIARGTSNWPLTTNPYNHVVSQPKQVQRGPSDRSPGFEDDDFGNSLCCWAVTSVSYCPSRHLQLTEKT